MTLFSVTMFLLRKKVIHERQEEVLELMPAGEAEQENQEVLVSILVNWRYWFQLWSTGEGENLVATFFSSKLLITGDWNVEEMGGYERLGGEKWPALC